MGKLAGSFLFFFFFLFLFFFLLFLGLVSRAWAGRKSLPRGIGGLVYI